MGGDVGPRPGAHDSSVGAWFWSLRCNALPFLPWYSMMTVWLPFLIGIVAHAIRTSKGARPFVRLTLPGARSFIERFCLLALICLCLFISICYFTGTSGTLDMCIVPGGSFAYVQCVASTVAGPTVAGPSFAPSAGIVWYTLVQVFVHVGSFYNHVLTILRTITWGVKFGQIWLHGAYFVLLCLVGVYRDTIRAWAIRTIALNRLTMYVLHNTLVWEIRSLRTRPRAKFGKFDFDRRCYECAEQVTPVQDCFIKRAVGCCSILLHRPTTFTSAVFITLPLTLINLPMNRVVCTICGGFFAGCNMYARAYFVLLCLMCLYRDTARAWAVRNVVLNWFDPFVKACAHSLRGAAIPLSQYYSSMTVWLPLLIGLFGCVTQRAHTVQPFVKRTLPGARAFSGRLYLLAFSFLCLFVSVCYFTGIVGTLDVCTVPVVSTVCTQCAVPIVAEPVFGQQLGIPSVTLGQMLVPDGMPADKFQFFRRGPRVRFIPCGHAMFTQYFIPSPFCVYFGFTMKGGQRYVSRALSNAAAYAISSFWHACTFLHGSDTGFELGYMLALCLHNAYMPPLFSIFKARFRIGTFPMRSVVPNRVTMCALGLTIVWELRMLQADGLEIGFKNLKKFASGYLFFVCQHSACVFGLLATFARRHRLRACLVRALVLIGALLNRLVLSRSVRLLVVLIDHSNCYKKCITSMQILPIMLNLRLSALVLTALIGVLMVWIVLSFATVMDPRALNRLVMWVLLHTTNWLVQTLRMGIRMQTDNMSSLCSEGQAGTIITTILSSGKRATGYLSRLAKHRKGLRLPFLIHLLFIPAIIGAVGAKRGENFSGGRTCQGPAAVAQGCICSVSSVSLWGGHFAHPTNMVPSVTTSTPLNKRGMPIVTAINFVNFRQGVKIEKLLLSHCIHKIWMLAFANGIAFATTGMSHDVFHTLNEQKASHGSLAWATEGISRFNVSEPTRTLHVSVSRGPPCAGGPGALYVWNGGVNGSSSLMIDDGGAPTLTRDTLSVLNPIGCEDRGFYGRRETHGVIMTFRPTGGTRGHHSRVARCL